jgi:hypothetical protein
LLLLPLLLPLLLLLLSAPCLLALTDHPVHQGC